VYLDSAYIAKFYVNEGDSVALRSLIERTTSLVSSWWRVAEVACVFHRHVREGSIKLAQAQTLTRSFLADVDSGFWTLIPVGEQLVWQVGMLVSTAPPNFFLRARDALHLITAQELGEPEIWTSDRRLLAAAPHFGIAGRSV